MGFGKNMPLIRSLMAQCPPIPVPAPKSQLYINEHFCHTFKFGIVTNGHGIIRHISFYNKNFMHSHPEIVVNKKSDSPDKDKCIHDSRLLIPTPKNFFKMYPLIQPKVFLRDAAFDTIDLYKKLLSGDTFGNARHFSRAYIPLNPMIHLENIDYTINEEGVPCCPHDSSVQMHFKTPQPETTYSLGLTSFISYKAY